MENPTYTERLEEIRLSALNYIRGRLDENKKYYLPDIQITDIHSNTIFITECFRFNNSDWYLYSGSQGNKWGLVELLPLEYLGKLSDEIYIEDINKIVDNDKNQEKI